MNKEISKLKDAFDAGEISMDDYIKGLQEIKGWANLTAEQQRELIRQWYDAEKEHTKHVQIGQQQLTQLSQSNKTKPTEYNAVGF